MGTLLHPASGEVWHPGSAVAAKSLPRSFEDALKSRVPLVLKGWLEEAFLRDYFENSLRWARLGLLLAIVLYSIVFGALDYWSSPEISAFCLVIRIGIALPMLLGLLVFSYSPRFMPLMQPLLTIAANVLGGGIIAIMWKVAQADPAGLGSTVRYTVPGLVLIIFSAYTLVRIRYLWAMFVGIPLSLAYLAVRAAIPPLGGDWTQACVDPVFMSEGAFFLAANAIGIHVGYRMEKTIRKDFVQQQIIAYEREESDRLLLNILPEAIARRKKNTSAIIADHHEEVSVLFADIVGFTPLAVFLAPNELIQTLNAIFTEFDHLAVTHNVEKIKTIGDGYMAAANLSLPVPDHAGALAAFALDIRDAIGQFKALDGSPMQLRIGIHTGKVVAGVIGELKFSYDLWGETVNLASRMESQSEPGRIQVTPWTRARLKAAYFLDPRRDKISVKGVGELQTYWLNGPKATGNRAVFRHD